MQKERAIPLAGYNGLHDPRFLLEAVLVVSATGCIICEAYCEHGVWQGTPNRWALNYLNVVASQTLYTCQANGQVPCFKIYLSLDCSLLYRLTAAVARNSVLQSKKSKMCFLSYLLKKHYWGRLLLNYCVSYPFLFSYVSSFIADRNLVARMIEVFNSSQNLALTLRNS